MREEWDNAGFPGNFPLSSCLDAVPFMDGAARLQHYVCSLLLSKETMSKGRTWIIQSFHILTLCQEIWQLDTGSRNHSGYEAKLEPWALVRGEGSQPAIVTYTSIRDLLPPSLKVRLCLSILILFAASVRLLCLVTLAMSPGYVHTWQTVRGHKL